MLQNKLSIALGATILSIAFSASIAPSTGAAGYHTLNDSPAGTYRVDPDHSLAWFTIGRAGVAVMVGRFDKMSGTYTFNPADPTADKANIRIDAASINTNLAQRDHDLRGPDFFNVKEFPDITFSSTRYEPTGKDAGLLYGELTMHGVTRPVIFHLREIGAGAVPALPKPWGGYLSGYEATATIQRGDFGMDGYAGMVDNTVLLHVNIVGIRTVD